MIPWFRLHFPNDFLFVMTANTMIVTAFQVVSLLLSSNLKCSEVRTGRAEGLGPNRLEAQDAPNLSQARPTSPSLQQQLQLNKPHRTANHAATSKITAPTRPRLDLPVMRLKTHTTALSKRVHPPKYEATLMRFLPFCQSTS